MVNFKKLKLLISQFENSKKKEQRLFYQRLKSIAETELRLTQIKLEKFIY